MTEDLHVEIQESTHAWSVVVRGEIDMETAPQLQATLERVIANGARLVTLELEHVNFVDSSGLRVIVAASTELRELGGSLFLGGATPAVLQVLELTGVIEHLRRSDSDQA